MLDSSRKRAEVYIIPFFITAIMLFVIFYKVGIYPFGERSLLIWDLRWQYIQFFSWFKQVLTGGGNLFYSFNAGTGKQHDRIICVLSGQSAESVDFCFLMIFRYLCLYSRY